MKGVHAMADVAKARKAKIAMTNRKEAKGVIQGIREKNAGLRRLVAELRTRVFVLERENKRLKATISKFQLESARQPNKKSNKAR
jgi:hypothetical protein